MPVDMTPMKLTDLTVVDLLSAFRAPEPTPGGGSASALAGAVGASLLVMIARLPKSRATADADIVRLRTAGARCGELTDALAGLVDRDSEAYDLVVAAYRRPKSTDAEKAARTSAIQAALRAAIAAPLDVMRACASSAEQSVVIAGLGNPSASSDVQVALELLGAGLRGARMNVEINLGSVKDEAYVAEVRRDIAALELRATEQAAAARRALT